MKTFYFLSLLVCFTFISCSTEEFVNSQDNFEANFIIPNPGGGIDGADGGTGNGSNEMIGETDLMAGQHIESGSVLVTMNGGSVEVEYLTDGDWVITETHLYIGDLADLPTNGGGNPKIGHFPYSGTHDPNTTSVTYTTIDLAEGECVNIVAHAVVVNTVTGQEETAWAAGDDLGGNNWSMTFEVCN